LLSGTHSLEEVQSYPGDYDGVMIGSPAYLGTRLDASYLQLNLWVQPSTSPNWIPADTWYNVIHPEALRQCDALDGLADGIISDPTKRHFNYAPLACVPGQNTSTCLTASQLSTLKKIYGDYTWPNGTFIAGGYYPGSELGLPLYLLTPDPVSFGAQTYQYQVLNDTN